METRRLIVPVLLIEIVGLALLGLVLQLNFSGLIIAVLSYTLVIYSLLLIVRLLHYLYSRQMAGATDTQTGTAFIADLPIYEDSSASARPDSLGFSGYAATLGEFAKTSNGPFTIGIQGSWGHGKTSLLRAIEAYLVPEVPFPGRAMRLLGRFLAIFYRQKAGQIIVPVRFNAWQYEREDRPLLPLILSITAALEEARTHHIYHYGQIEQLRKVLQAIAAGAVASTELKADAVGTGLGVTMNSAEFANETTNTIRPSRRMAAVLAYRTAYYQAFQLLQEACKGMSSDVKIVMFIDDLDRCSPQKALDVLEDIKLVLWQPQFIFFLAIDSIQLESYINGTYRTMLGDSDTATKDWGREYFEKLMQVTFRIPQHIQWYDVFIEQLYQTIGWNSQAKKAIKPLLSSPLAYNPRRTIGVMNTILLIEALLPDSFRNNTDLIAVEVLLKLRYGKRLYTLLCGDGPDENEIMRSHVLGWEQRLRNPKQIPPRFAKNPEGEKLRELWEYLAGDETLQDVFYSAPGLEWLQAADDERRGFARLIEDQRIENNFVVSDISPIAKGNEAYMRGDLADAAEYFQDAIKRDEHNIDAYIGLQKIEHSIQKQESAMRSASLNNAGELTSWLENLWEITQQSTRDKQYGRAEKALLTILKFDERNASAYNRLGILYAKQKAYTDAIDAFKMANKLEPSASSLHNLGLIYFETKQYGLSAQVFKKAISADDQHAPRFIAYAKALEKLGRTEQMIEALEQAAKIDPSRSTLRLLAETYETYGYTRKAQALRRVIGTTSRSRAKKAPPAATRRASTPKKTSKKATTTAKPKK